MLKSLVAALAIAVCALPSAISAEEAVDAAAENQELRSRIDRLESLVDQLHEPTVEAPRVSAALPPRSGERGYFGEPDDSDGTVEHASFSTWNLSNALNSPPGTFPNVRLTGFFQADVGWVHQDAGNMAAVGDVQDGADFRRARLAATGNVADNVGYMLELDFAFPGRPNFMDVWGEVHNLDFLQNVRFGQYRQPFGLDGLTSVKELTFLERSLPFAFLPFRQIGVMAHGVSEQEDMTWWFSGFRAQTDAFGSNVGDSGYGLATRLTGVVMDDGAGSVVHVGGAYSLINPTSGAVEYRNQPEFFVSDSIFGTTPFFVDTLAVPTDHVNLFAGELAATSGPWHAQGEVIYAFVDRMAASKATFSGASIQTGYILTGEHRPYDRKNGVLGRIVPHENFGSDGGCGAWEIAGRWSYLDLNDGGTNGGQLNDLTAGLNWYLNGYTKLQLNYVHAFLKTPGLGDSDADIVAMRAQVNF